MVLPDLTKQADTKATAKKGGKQTRKQRLKEEGAAFVEAELELLAEYQTLRRMNKASDFILFTVRTYINPFANLQQAPGNASPKRGQRSQCRELIALRHACTVWRVSYCCDP
eukprot:COSAG02_NODE_2360_length_9063_cov_19.715529_6_plen_112_part_00